LAGSATAQTVERAPRVPREIRAPTRSNTIDDLVLARLARLGVQPAAVSSDAVFVRRVYLDVIGTLPTADETKAFLADQNPGRRDALIDRLLTRDEFADYWAMKWSDLLRVKSEFPINLWPNAVQAYHHWIRTSVRDNMPYDRFARELLTSSGSNFRVPQVNFYRAVQSREPRALASAVALTFMGVRAERWPAARLSDMAMFFSAVGYKPTQEWKEEIIFYDPGKVPPNAEGPAFRVATLPDSTTVRLTPDDDPREVFANWLIRPENPWFTPAIANRVWSWLLGRGIADEPDDMRPDNPPTNPELLAYLSRELVAAKYDVKHLFRLILNSATYQRSSIADGSDTAEGEANFSHYIQRPLDAEVLIDAIDQITGTGEQFSSAIPEPYTFIPTDHRAIALADGSITNAFLETFGRPSRDLGLESERHSRVTAAERLALLNSGQIQRKLEQSATLQALIQSPVGIRPLVTNLYLTILSRPPTVAELNTAAAYAQSPGVIRRTAALDIAWALINGPEFLYRH
jgi:hypothetical protein